MTGQPPGRDPGDPGLRGPRRETVGKYPELTRRRVARLQRALRDLVVAERQPLEVAAWHVLGEPVPPAEAFAAPYRPFAVGEAWGPPWTTTWFRMRGRVAPSWAARRVAAVIDITGGGDTGFTGEGLVYCGQRVLQGVSPNHRVLVLGDDLRAGDDVELHVEAAANPREHTPGLFGRVDADADPMYRLVCADLALLDVDAEQAHHDVRVLTEMLAALPQDDPRAAHILMALNDACNAHDPRAPRTSVAAVRACVAPVLAVPAAPSAHRITAVGHAHIDSAWLWPARETRRKCARSFSTVLRLMERYPDFHFACSQAAQYAWIKADHPELYARIREAVAAGRWEPVGSMWVEADCNLAGGESLVRQLLLGKRFYLEEFGVETHDAWLPDVFGYAANLPQLFRKAGIDFFLTQKLSWNQFNRMPHTTFLWQGIDGTRVLTHFPPADTYNGSFEADEVIAAARRHREHGRSDRSLYLFGWGDGGGGPTPEMLESAHRLRDLEGAPRVELGTVRSFSQAVAADSRDLATWVGELYLETHRGTYTTQARTKLGNRLGEVLLRDAELLSVVCGRTDPATRDALQSAWRTLLFNQFHDIIPGSSIPWVYEVAEAEYAALQTSVGAVRDAGMSTIADAVDTSGMEAPLVCVNTSPVARRTVVEVPGDATRLLHVDLPALGYRVYDLAAQPTGGDPPPAPASAQGDVLENDLLRVHFDAGGLISSIYDKEHAREVVAPDARANVFQLHDDDPLVYDAWDVDVFDRETVSDVAGLEESVVELRGPLRAQLRQTRRFGSSTIVQRISLDAGSRMLRFATEVDWQESKRLLKVAFPVDVQAPEAAFEVQFGHVTRPTHRNTSWDVARFEVCGRRWADLSDGRYGVALLNDCKHGYDILGNVMRLSLLRAPSYPDPNADRGHHRFTYALLPHAGGPTGGGVIEAAYDLNNPVLLATTGVHGGAAPEQRSFFSVDAPGVFVEAVKVAEDGDEVVVRLYEGFGGRCTARLRCRSPLRSAQLTDLLEREVAELPLTDDGAIPLEFGPFEVHTVKLRCEARWLG